jgi:hypothetical protein
VTGVQTCALPICGRSSDGDLAGLSKAELEKRAKKAGITGYSKMKKEELVEALEAA